MKLIALEKLLKKTRFAVVDGPFGTQLHASDYTEKGIPLIRIKNIGVNRFIFDDIKFITEKKFQDLKRSAVYPNDILLAKTGATIGKVCLVPREIKEGLIASSCAKISIDEQKASPALISYFLNTNYCYKQIIGKSVGSTRSTINLENIKRIKVPDIPLSIQRKIASILEKAESVKGKRKEANRLTDEFLKSAFLEMFGDPVRNTKGWKICEVEDIAANEKHSIKAGPFGSSLKKEYYVKKGYKIYGQEQVIKDDLTFGDYYISEEKYKTLASNKIKEGDILISLVGTFGKISVVPKKFEPGIINPRLMKITLNQKMMIPILFKFLLVSEGIRARIENYSHGGTMGIVNVGIMKKIKIPVPPIPLQQKFANLVQKVEKLKEKQRESENELNNLFNSLMQKAFRGELA
jgi:type I restriction enzyme S subunit